MTIYTEIVALSATPAALTGLPSPPLACRVRVEPAAANTAIAYTGISTINTSTLAGVIHEHIVPSATVIRDVLLIEDQNGANRIDLSQFYFAGTTGDKLLVTWFVD